MKAPGSCSCTSSKILTLTVSSFASSRTRTSAGAPQSQRFCLNINSSSAACTSSGTCKSGGMRPVERLLLQQYMHGERGNLPLQDQDTRQKKRLRCQGRRRGAVPVSKGRPVWAIYNKRCLIDEQSTFVCPSGSDWRHLSTCLGPGLVSPYLGIPRAKRTQR